MILDRVNSPIDLRQLNSAELETLAEEMRELIIKKVNVTGGHFGPNLGIVETTIAMHYVFDAPNDKFIFDVSHQCYPHKMITGRKEGFINPEMYLKYTGYTAPEEGEYDLFKVGHTSTSVSLACGVAKARDLRGEKYNVVALIGDGSLSGGEALEGLDNGATLGTNFIVIVNDNDQSIAENHGGLYDNLKFLRDTDGKAECNFFKALGYDYYLVKEGNNIEALIKTFNKVKDINHPVVVHVCTQKGKGFKLAEENREAFHWILPGALNEKSGDVYGDGEGYTSITNDFILKKAKEDKRIIVINAGTPGVFGWNKTFREQLGEQYTDVGIAEEHACAYASALAKSGAKPIWAVMSSFVQRTYDQLSQDLCLNCSPLTMLVHWGGISSADATHLCTFDIPLIKNIPNMVYLSPTYKEEYMAMLNWSVVQNERPVAIRVPNIELTSKGEEDNTDYSVLNKYKVMQEGENVAILGVGNFYPLAEQTAELLKTKLGIKATIINPRFLTGVDKELMESLKSNHKLVITLEDGLLDGGFGEMISRFYGCSDMKVLNYGSLKEFTDRTSLDELHTRYRLKPELIVEDIKKVIL